MAAKEDGKYLFIPEDATEDDKMSEWSDVSGVTAGEYAKQNGLSIIHISGGIKNSEELGIDASSLSFRSVADDVMDVYFSCQTKSVSAVADIAFVTTTRSASTGDIGRKEMRFTLENLSAMDIYSYVPSVQQHPDGYEIEKADVIQTDLGTYVDVIYKEYRDDKPEELIILARLLDENGKVIESIGGSGLENTDEGQIKYRKIYNKTMFGDALNIELYNLYDGTVYGSATLEKVCIGF